MGKFEKYFQIHIQKNIKNIDNSKRSFKKMLQKTIQKKKGYKKWWADKKQRLLGSEEYLF